MRILGLDIQKNAIAAVEVDTAFGKFEVRDTHEMKLDAGYDPIGAAAQLLASLPKQPDRLVQTIPTTFSTFRNLNIASKDKKAVRAALEFELEDDLPFESDLLHYDSVILQSGAQGSSIHVGATRRDALEPWLESLRAASIDPEVLTTEPWVYRSLIARMIGTRDLAPPVLLMGIEEERTFFYVQNAGVPLVFREIPFGLIQIQHELAQRFENTSPEESRRWILDLGLAGVDESVSNALFEILDRWIPEIKQTELAVRATLPTSIDQIWITGEGALIPGLQSWLQQNTERPVALFRPLSQIAAGSVTYSDHSEVRFARALGMAMALVSVDKLSPINLRKGAFSKQGAPGFSTLDLIKKPLPYAITLLSILLITKTIEVKYYQGRLDETEDTVKRAVKNYFGGISDSAVRNHLADMSRLKRNIEGDLAKERELSKLLSPNAGSPFDFLKVISNKISKDVVLDLVQYDVGSDFTESFKDKRAVQANLTFLVASATSLAKLTEILQKDFGFKKGNSEEITQEGRKTFKVSFTGSLNQSGGSK